MKKIYKKSDKNNARLIISKNQQNSIKKLRKSNIDRKQISWAIKSGIVEEILN